MGVEAIKERKFKKMSGVLVPAAFELTNDLCFLTSFGTYYRIVKNSKYPVLKSKVGECVELIGNVSFTNSIPLLEVFSFSLDYDSVVGAESEMNDEAEEIYHDINSVSPRIDYDYMYT